MTLPNNNTFAEIPMLRETVPTTTPSIHYFFNLILQQLSTDIDIIPYTHFLASPHQDIVRTFGLEGTPTFIGYDDVAAITRIRTKIPPSPTDILFIRGAVELDTIIAHQKQGGTLVLTIETVAPELLYTLTFLYESVALHNIATTSTGKYVVCKRFANKRRGSVAVAIPLSFINKLEEVNIILANQQLDTIYSFINIIKKNKLKGRSDEQVTHYLQIAVPQDTYIEDG